MQYFFLFIIAIVDLQAIFKTSFFLPFPVGSRPGSRRGSRASNASQTSVRTPSPRTSPTKPIANSTKAGSSENVTIEMKNENEKV